MKVQNFVSMDTNIRRFHEFPSSLDQVLKRTFWQPLALFLLLLVLWFLMPAWLSRIDETTGNVDQGIWLLILLSLICFLLVLGMCWWLLQYGWLKLGLPSIQKMVLQFNSLDSWQQLSFYWASFVSLLLAASIIVSAIC